MQDMSAAQVIAIRGAMVCLLLFAIAWHRKALPSLSALKNPYLIIRTLADAGTTFLFMLALANMPIANASAIYQALPLVVTVGAALFLGESVGWRRWTATFIGFIGVVIIVRPAWKAFPSIPSPCSCRWSPPPRAIWPHAACRRACPP